MKNTGRRRPEALVDKRFKEKGKVDSIKGDRTLKESFSLGNFICLFQRFSVIFFHLDKPGSSCLKSDWELSKVVYQAVLGRSAIKGRRGNNRQTQTRESV